MDFKKSFRLLIILIFTFSNKALFSQSELSFEGTFEVSFPNSSATITNTTFSIPSGEVYKITSVGCGIGELSTDRGRACYLHLDGNLLFARSAGYNSVELPIWLDSGTYTLQLYTSGVANDSKGFIYGVKFKLE